MSAPMTSNELRQEIIKSRDEFIANGTQSLNEAKEIAQRALIDAVRRGERTLTLGVRCYGERRLVFEQWLSQAGCTVEYVTDQRDGDYYNVTVVP